MTTLISVLKPKVASRSPSRRIYSRCSNTLTSTRSLILPVLSDGSPTAGTLSSAIYGDSRSISLQDFRGDGLPLISSLVEPITHPEAARVWCVLPRALSLQQDLYTSSQFLKCPTHESIGSVYNSPCSFLCWQWRA